MELSEKWKWTSGDYSEGESLLVEVWMKEIYEYKKQR